MLPRELDIYQDWVSNATTFYPEWVIASLANAQRSPTNAMAFTDLRQSVQGLASSITQLRRIKDKLETASPGLGSRGLDKSWRVAIQIQDYLDDNGPAGMDRKEVARLLNDYRAPWKDLVDIKPLIGGRAAALVARVASNHS